MRFLAILLVALSGGCMNSHTVKKVTEDNRATVKGLRFHLPVKYVKVDPQPDGSVKAEFAYFGDPENEFAISSSSFLQNNALSVTVASGLLKKVSYTQDNAGTLAAIAEQAGAVEAARAKARVTASKEEAKAAQTKKDALTASRDAAALAFALAQKELEILEDQGADAGTIETAERAVAKAELTLEAAKKLLEGEEAGGLLDSLGNTPPTTAYGPAFFRVEEREGDLRLVAVEVTDGAHQHAIPVQARPPEVDDSDGVPDCPVEGKDFSEVFGFVATTANDIVTELALSWKLDEAFGLALISVEQGATRHVNVSQTEMPWKAPVRIDASEPITISVSEINGAEDCGVQTRYP